MTNIRLTYDKHKPPNEDFHNEPDDLYTSEEVRHIANTVLGLILILFAQGHNRTQLEMALDKFEHKCSAKDWNAALEICAGTNPLLQRLTVASENP